MAQNITDGLTVFLDPGAIVASGGVVISGNYVGIAEVDGVSGTPITVNLEGVYPLAKNASIALTIGDALYWDTSPGEITNVVADGTFIGYAHETVLAAATKLEVKLARGAPVAPGV